MEMKQKLIDLTEVPISFIYGNKSHIWNGGAYLIQEQRPSVRVKKILGAGHHVHAEKEVEFNEEMIKILAEVDKGDDQRRNPVATSS